VRGFGGVSGDLAFLAPPPNIYGGLTGDIAAVGPQRGFGGLTGGSVAFTGVAPAVRLTAVGVAPSVIELAWVIIGGAQTGFRIERSPNGQGMWTVIGSVPADFVLFLDLNATPLVVFDYRVIAFNPAEDAPPSNIAYAYSPAPGGPPPSSTPLPSRNLEFLSPGAYGLERDVDGNVGGSKF